MLLILVLVGGLVTYKATASLAVLQKAADTGVFRPRALLSVGELATRGGLFSQSAAYLAIVWPALIFGIVIAAAVRTLVPPAWLAERLGGGPVRAQLAGAVAGAPLMLCSCCVAPIFTTVYERSRRLAPSLAVMLAAPSLNPAALALTFMFFRPAVAWSRLTLAVAAVFVGAVCAAWVLRPPVLTPLHVRAATFDDEPLARAFLRSCLHVTVQTLPLLLVGILASMAIAARFTVEGASWPAATGLSVALAALIALPIALPTFFEVPIALTLLGTGAPTGVAVAVLFAGPAVNLPSLLTIARATGWKASLSVASVVWILAVVGGLLAQAAVG